MIFGKEVACSKVRPQYFFIFFPPLTGWPNNSGGPSCFVCPRSKSGIFDLNLNPPEAEHFSKVSIGDHTSFPFHLNITKRMTRQSALQGEGYGLYPLWIKIGKNGNVEKFLSTQNGIRFK